MSIGIDFLLRANSADFTRGLAAANNSIKKMKHSLSESGGRKLEHVFGIAGVIEGFKLVINHAQEARKALEDMGKPVSDNIRSLAEYGDQLDNIKKGLMDVASSALGFFTKGGEGIGAMILAVTNKFREMKGKAALETDEKGDRAAKKQEDAADAARKSFEHRNSHDEMVKLADKLAAVRRKYDEEGMTAEEKKKLLIQDQNDLIVERLRLENMPVKDAAKIEENKIAQAEKAFEIRKANSDIDKGDAAKHDKYRMTLEQFSNSQIDEGMYPAKRKAIMDAREVNRLEALAAQQGYAGKLNESDLTMGRANQLRQGLAGYVKSDDVNKDKDFADAIQKLNDTLTTKALVVTKVY